MIDARYMLDANICVYLLNGASAQLRQQIEAVEVGAVAASAVAFAEVMIGAQLRSAAAAASRLFDIVTVLPFDRHAAEAYARLPFRRGKFDRLIAAHALSLDLTLITNNAADFSDIDGLRIENWTQA